MGENPEIASKDYLSRSNTTSLDGQTYTSYDADSASSSSYWMLELDATQRSYIQQIMAFGYQWRIEEAAKIGGEVICKATYAGPLNDADFQKWWDSFSADAIQVHTEKLAEWAKTVYPDSQVTMYFVHGDDNLGTAYAE